MSRTGLRWLALLLGLCSATHPALAQPVDEAKAAQVKAAYLLNFLRYTQWPDSAFADPQSPYRVAVLGDGQVAVALEALARRAGPIEGRPIRVGGGPLRLEAGGVPEAVRGAHLVYLGGAQGGAQLPELRRRLGKADVLLVGDATGFAAAGGMLGLALEQGRIVFDANLDAIRRSEVLVSSKVLKLARIVEEEAPR
ncbi:MAG TPA: YfiR family protein [Solimonas sp.]|nr:YfiR family protein [Solimonas sp.]